MFTRSQEPIVVITVNQEIPLARKRKRELPFSTTVTASVADLSDTPQSRCICTQGSISIASSTIIREESESVNKPILSFGSSIQQNITGMVELAAPSDQYIKDACQACSSKDLDHGRCTVWIQVQKELLPSISNKTTNSLAGKEELKDMYPELLGGGCVQMDGKDETTRGFLGKYIWKQLKDTPVCVHRRMATRGFGKDLDTVRSIPELIIVLADAMKIYTDIQDLWHLPMGSFNWKHLGLPL